MRKIPFLAIAEVPAETNTAVQTRPYELGLTPAAEQCVGFLGWRNLRRVLVIDGAPVDVSTVQRGDELVVTLSVRGYLPGSKTK